MLYLGIRVPAFLFPNHYRGSIMFNKNKRWLKLSFFVFFFMIYFKPCIAQQDQRIRDQYMLTEEQKLKLQIVVHVWGEVNRAGQYVVPDGTTVLELISMAGGPSNFSNLKNVKLTREETYTAKNGKLMRRKLIYRIDMDTYLNKNRMEHIHVLKPGDVVQVKRNSWFRFETFLKVITQIAIIIQGLYYTGIIDTRK